MTQTYCTAAHIEFVLSEFGLTAVLDDDESGVASVAEEERTTTAITWTASTINQAVGIQYKLSDVTSNTALQMANAILAAELLCQRRNNPIPEVLGRRCERLRDWLTEIRWGRQQLPEQNASFDHLPTVTNFDIIPGSYNPVSVDIYHSTGDAPVDGVTRPVAGSWGWY